MCLCTILISATFPAVWTQEEMSIWPAGGRAKLDLGAQIGKV